MCGRFGFSYFCADLLDLCGVPAGTDSCKTLVLQLSRSYAGVRIGPVDLAPLRRTNNDTAAPRPECCWCMRSVWCGSGLLSIAPKKSQTFCMFRWWVRILSVVVQLVRLPCRWSRSGCHLNWLEPLPIPAGPTKRTLFPCRRPVLRHVLLSDAADSLSTWEKCRRCPEVPLPGASLARAAVVPLRSFRAIFGWTPS